ncbi:MAG: T9SS type A sorting domain-containing protein [Clostridium sp.]|nr:T9SS type A sorting domain-containing protein [Clostridium sp.]
MEFADQATAIESVAGDQLPAEPLEVYTSDGRHIGRFATIEDVRSNIAGRSGIYIVNAGSQTFKIAVK